MMGVILINWSQQKREQLAPFSFLMVKKNYWRVNTWVSVQPVEPLVCVKVSVVAVTV